MEGSRRLARHAERKMDATLSSGAALGRVVNLVCALALVLSPLFLGIAAWHLWTRIIRSALGLSAAARAFGAGEMKARAAVDEDDEMGEVCRTFNVMAEAIAARDRDRFDFMAAVAHDLQNPLSAIIGTTDLLRQNEAAPEAKRRAWLDRITAQSRRLELMTFNLTDTVQKMTGRVALQTRPLDLERLIREVAEEQAGTVREDRVIRVRVEKRPIVLGDAAQLERVFANLLSNALKYSDERSEIDVALEIRGEEAVATVTDRGIGISPEELRDIFEPYWREGGTAGRVRGTGLGLFAAHSIVVAHGGRITIDSERGAGTTVTVTLPLESELAASRPEPG
jgi:signal transduction histidine kinase